MNLTKYLAHATSVGDCHGQEKEVADNLNRIYRAVDTRIGDILVVGGENQYDLDKYHEIMRAVWRDWGNSWGNKKEALLSLTDKDIEDYLEKVCARHTIVVCGKEVCAEYPLNELGHSTSRRDS